jgi:4a-hydroxytetrahydrobiopterin dehydratase
MFGMFEYKHTMNNWIETASHLEKTFTFDSFESAMLFMQKAAVKIAELDHHPTWANTFNRIHIVLSTHDAGNKVTEKDWELAQELDSIYQQN